MNKGVFACILALCFSAPICFWIHYSTVRYTTVSNADGEVLKLDRRTGVSSSIAEESAPTKIRPQKNEDAAISLAKNGRHLDLKKPPADNTLGIYVPLRSNETYIRDSLNSKKGVLNIQGWSAERKDENKFLVRFTYDQGGNPLFIPFEVTLEPEIVRLVIGDEALEKAYGFHSTP